MAPKRKRSRTTADDGDNVGDAKRSCNQSRHDAILPFDHPTLKSYYERISTLRQYLLTALPKSCQKRRRKIAQIGRGNRDIADVPDTTHRHTNEKLGDDISLADLLDKTYVCSSRIPHERGRVDRRRDFEAFSQQIGITARSGTYQNSSSQSEVVDFSIWVLFNRIYSKSHRPNHMLCHGYQRIKTPRQAPEDVCAAAGIPGLVSFYPNHYVSLIKGRPWILLHGMLGADGDEIMHDLILYSSVFRPIEGGKNNLYQVSGKPLTDLTPLTPESKHGAMALPSLPPPLKALQDCPSSEELTVPRSPASITIVRNRMFYARAVLNAKGKVTFGLRHIHALNRYPNHENRAHTVHLLKYIFPRQFGLHNAFTSMINSQETIQPFKDYTLREQEIARHDHLVRLRGEYSGSRRSRRNSPVPKRLRDGPYRVVSRMQKLHIRCSYYSLLTYYCPLQLCALRNTKEVGDSRPANAHGLLSQLSELARSSFMDADGHSKTKAESKATYFDLATCHEHVSSFCRAALSKLIPHEIWGEGAARQENQALLMKNVDRFVKLNRFETFSLHTLLQGMKIRSMAWLAGPGTDPHAKATLPDTKKRTEIFLEFLYYVFDSILISLIRSNFHVTESGAHQNRLFYFRHDVWRALTEPAMAKMKLTMFEEMDTTKAKRLMDARALGFSQIRLLPKASGVRPITNLRRRVTKLQNGKVTLARSINSVMAPVYNMLDYEKRKRPEQVGSSLFSASEMYPLLKAFAQKRHDSSDGFYFAKVDVKSCFDTIPQRKVIKMIERLVSEPNYKIARHAEIKTTADAHDRIAGKTSKPARKFINAARAASDFEAFERMLDTSRATKKKDTVFVDGIVQQAYKADSLLDLLEEHVDRNIIKIGKKFFRQKSGIPQGSVVSSLLCNYFYADLEREFFGFLDPTESLLLRLIDDFLLITRNQSHALRFLQIMHDGVPAYGVNVNPAKSLTNFRAIINGHEVPQQARDLPFPFCGNTIGTKSLEISKDRDRRRDTVLANSLTVEPSKVPGATFYRKALNAFKIQTHEMFLDTEHNPVPTVHATIYQNFAEAGMKLYRYAKGMPTKKQPPIDLLMRTIRDMIDLAYALTQGKHKCHKTMDYRCAVSKRQVRWLAGSAFIQVLGAKQTKYRPILAWLEGIVADAQLEGKEAERLKRSARESELVFQGYRY